MRRSRERPLIAVFCIIAAFGAVGNFDYADALDREAEEKLAMPLREIRLANTSLPASFADCRRGGVPGAVLTVNVTGDGVHLWRRTCLEPKS